MNIKETNVSLKEIIHPQMDILFVALNAPVKSNTNKHWFSGNLSFWNVLFDAGIITKRIKDPLIGDEMVFVNNSINYNELIFGITDLNRELVQTSSNNVKTTTEQVQRILSIIDNNNVGKLCLLHSKVAKQFEKEKLINRKSGQLDGYGVVGRYNNVPIYEVPFHNASKDANGSLIDKFKYYKLLIE